jgi:hypothetical protein
VLRRLDHRRRLDVDWTNELGRYDGCGDLVGCAIIIPGEKVAMAKKERRFDIQKTSYASAPCSAAARAVAQLGFAGNSFGTVLAALPLIGAAGFTLGQRSYVVLR